VQFGPYHVICAVGVDENGHKHVLGFRDLVRLQACRISEVGVLARVLGSELCNQ